MRTGSFRNPPPPLQAPAPPLPSGFPPQGLAMSERAPRRRRTGPSGEFTSVAYALTPASTLPPVQAAFPGQGTMILPPLRRDTPTAQPATGASIPPPTSTGPPQPFDPFARGYQWG
jgi:hypothetical protein